MSGKRITIRLIVTVLSLYFANSIFVNNTFATSVSVDKPVMRFTIAAGSSASDVLIVRNKGIESLLVKTGIHDWTFDVKRELILAPPRSTPYSCSDWIDISPQDLVIPAGEERELAITIRVPEDSVGGHYAALSVESTPGTYRHEGIGARVVARIIVLLLQETEGKSNKVGEIISFDVTPPEKNKPLVANYLFKNQGNTYLSVKGVVNIMDKDGNLYGRAESERLQGSFPQDIVEDSIEWFGSLKKGEYDVILTVDIGKDVFPVVGQKPIVIEEDID